MQERKRRRFGEGNGQVAVWGEAGIIDMQGGRAVAQEYLCDIGGRLLNGRPLLLK